MNGKTFADAGYRLTARLNVKDSNLLRSLELLVIW